MDIPVAQLFGIEFTIGDLMSIHIYSALIIAVNTGIRIKIWVAVVHFLGSLLNPFSFLIAGWVLLVNLKRLGFAIIKKLFHGIKLGLKSDSNPD